MSEEASFREIPPPSSRSQPLVTIPMGGGDEVTEEARIEKIPPPSRTQPPVTIPIGGGGKVIEEAQEMKRKKRKRRRRRAATTATQIQENSSSPAIEPPLSPPSMGGRYLLTKILKSNDVEPACNRILINAADNWYTLITTLNDEERGKVLSQRDFLSVPTKTQNGGRYVLKLTNPMHEYAYSLSDDWNKIVAENELKEGDGVSFWGYHVGDQFRLELTFAKYD